MISNTVELIYFLNFTITAFCRRHQIKWALCTERTVVRKPRYLLEKLHWTNIHYGQSVSWLSQLCRWLDLDYDFRPTITFWRNCADTTLTKSARDLLLALSRLLLWPTVVCCRKCTEPALTTGRVCRDFTKGGFQKKNHWICDHDHTSTDPQPSFLRTGIALGHFFSGIFFINLVVRYVLKHN